MTLCESFCPLFRKQLEDLRHLLTVCNSYKRKLKIIQHNCNLRIHESEICSAIQNGREIKMEIIIDIIKARTRRDQDHIFALRGGSEVKT